MTPHITNYLRSVFNLSDIEIDELQSFMKRTGSALPLLHLVVNKPVDKLITKEV